MEVRKSDGSYELFDKKKLKHIIKKTFQGANIEYKDEYADEIINSLYVYDGIMCSSIRKQLERRFAKRNESLLKAYTEAKDKRDMAKDFVEEKKAFIERYKKSSNTANATVDDNSNVSSKNIGVLNAEIHKTDNILISRGMIMDELKRLYPDFNPKNYVKDLERHILYKHDESSFSGAIASYCASITMYPYLTNGLKGIGGQSGAPKNLNSYCGTLINLIFAISSQFAGALAVPEALVCFSYFCKKEWGEYFWKRADDVVTVGCVREKTIRSQIHQYFQQIIYTINAPASGRNMQCPFVNFSFFDRHFFDGMFGNFYFPDGTQPDWESTDWIQREFMRWFNEDARMKAILTFPVESFALIYKDGKFQDEETATFVAEELERGHSFFVYISDSVDSLSSCCRLKNKIQTREFNFTNGNMGVQTGSKSVITLNMSRIVQDWFNGRKEHNETFMFDGSDKQYASLCAYINKILERVYKYHTAYNELLWGMYDADLLPVYKAGFIDLNKQYLTIGVNGVNQAAEFLGMKCSDNDDYSKFCTTIFGNIKEQNARHKVTDSKHKMTFNTECVPAESLAIKNYNWDKEDDYWVPTDTNLYASYIFKPNDPNVSVLEKIRMHGNRFIGDFLDGGSSAHLNLDSHLSKEQYMYLLNYAAENGCQYLTFNVPNCQCEDCGYIAKTPFDKCPKCGSTHVSLWDRVIGYLTKIKNWGNGRQIEQKTRVYEKINSSALC